MNENEVNQKTTQLFEEVLTNSSQENYLLRLYIAGTTVHSLEALKNIKKICEEHLEGRYQLEVIDVYQNSESMINANIVAIPTLIKELPLPLQKLIGNLSDREKVLIGLNLILNQSSKEDHE
ncbi:circadian clock KaiB family protein [Geminocystis sp. GBBB08]|uniref:circadian clock KaiB family protein n=1 Tax=Geminocystis sp. GBBB08 TaxID=2604140 RepID=UPI0027E2C2B3|nr:circadian clock KaiB family protein [Geminocystis sp. GBBB08]MBL1210303.1 thiol-disulfide isomerase [Geminocystis sp. GBBB08]